MEKYRIWPEQAVPLCRNGLEISLRPAVSSLPENPAMNSSLPLLPALAGLTLLTGVSCTGWPRGWEEAKRMPASQGPAGAWQGTWHSIPTGHRGNLRCAVFPKGDGVWNYRYRASWAKVLCAGFTLDCRATREADATWRVEGSRDLGRVFGGTFTHTGTIKGDQLQAEYKSAADHGTLTLHRLESK